MEDEQELNIGTRALRDRRGLDGIQFTSLNVIDEALRSLSEFPTHVGRGLDHGKVIFDALFHAVRPRVRREIT